MYGRLTTSLAAELIGTFALIFIGAGSVALSSHLVGIALAHGLVVLAFAYVFGPISGAYINPAVTLGVWAAGKIEAGRAAAYIAVQLAGGVLAALALRWVLGGTGTGLGVTRLAQNLDLHGLPYTVTPAVGLFVEALITFFLANTVINVSFGAGSKTTLGGVAAGFTLAFCILMAGPLTGASANPARTLGPAVAAGIFDDIWVYFAGQAVGGLAAGFLWKGLFAKE